MKILVTGGGTGGHIYPALAFIDYVKQQDTDAKFLYVGTNRGLESTIVPPTGIPFKTIEIQGFRRSLSLENIKTIQLFIKSIGKAKQMLREFQPDIVIGTGGYVSGAVMYAAAKMNIPTIVHEQNSVPGITNKFLSRYVNKVAIAFTDAKQYFPEEKVVLIGNPRGQQVASTPQSAILTEYHLNPNKKTVLIFGGSQGALKINQAVTAALPQFGNRSYQLLYASGERYFEELSGKVDVTSQQFNNISIQPYIKKMPEVMANVDLMVGRAGATTIAEITALGLPAILIPSPYVTNDHQTKNAQSLVTAGAVTLIPDSDLTGHQLLEAIDNIMENEELQQQMAAASKQTGIVDASDRLYQLVKELV